MRVFAVIQAIVVALTICPQATAQASTVSRSNGAVASVDSEKRTQKTAETPPSQAKDSPARPSVPKAEAEAEVRQQLQPAFEGVDGTPQEDSSQDMSGAPPEGEAQLRVRISVPQYVRPVSSITIYPYPTRIPKATRGARKIDSREKSIKGTLLSLGYGMRSSESKMFPTNGWRWQYILRAACKKSGTHPPTNIFTMYPWVHKMIPYVQEEIKRVNEIEDERQVRYQSAVKDFEENGQDLESQALQKGLAPIELKMKAGTKKLLSGVTIVAPGTWYVVATHKTANLKFFWQVPITVSAGENSTVQLTQTNALIIDGTW